MSPADQAASPTPNASQIQRSLRERAALIRQIAAASTRTPL